MKWFSDDTRRFSKRPHWEPAELDIDCEAVVAEFLIRKHSAVTYPISTDDLTNLIEERAQSLDLYADLSDEGVDVEGVTYFVPGQKPSVCISKLLSNDPRMSNRLRTTLTHELGHVILHTALYDAQFSTGNLFGPPTGTSNKCRRDKILGAALADWMEWQAGYACSALLVPATGLTETIRQFSAERGSGARTFAVASAEGQALIDMVAAGFEVSKEAARVRLEQKGILGTKVSGTLFPKRA